MCGIVGVARTEREGRDRADVGRVEQALAQLRRRGPDDSRTWQGDGCVLGVARLAMSDVPHGQQPWETDDGAAVLAFNGEIYAAHGLRARLARKGCRFRTTSDTEVLAALLRIDGVGALAEVDGQYSIAYWDRHCRSLTLVRDRFGIHPLYYALTGYGVVFGSAASVVADIVGPRTVNRSAIRHSLVSGGVPESDSVYEGVRQVSAGYALQFSPGGAREVPVDPIRFPPAGEERRTLDDDELRAAFDEAVHNRLQADVPLGLMLSGGVDSGAVAASVGRLGYRLPAYTVASAGADIDEATVARKVASRFGHDFRPVPVDGTMLATRLTAAAHDLGDPQWRPGPIGFDLLAERVSADGVKGLLTGDGADELFCGYDVFKHTLIRRALGRRPTAVETLRLFDLVPSTAGMVRGNALPSAMAPFAGGDVELTYSHMPRWRTAAGGAAALLSEDLRREHASLSYARHAEDTYGTELATISPLNRARFLELRTMFTPFLISVQSDRPLAQHGVEGRHPFLSRKVADIAIRTDPRLMVSPLHDKFPVRQALVRPYLPFLARAPKVPYEPGWVALRDAPPFHDLCRDVLSNRAVRHAGMFEPARVDVLVERALAPDHRRERQFGVLLQVLTSQVLFNG